MKFCLDPGHYKNYNKGIVAGYFEGNRMPVLAKYLKEELESYGQEVILTRTNDNDVALDKRGKMAAGCDYFISLHSNAFSDPSARGASLYRSYKFPDSQALGVKIGNMIAGILPNSYSRGCLTRAYPGTTNTDYYAVVRAAAPVVKKGAYLIEHGFHTNQKECEFLFTDKGLKELAVGYGKLFSAEFGWKKSGTVTSSEPKPSEPVTPSVSSDSYVVHTRLGGYYTAANALKDVDRRVWVEPGTYYVYNKSGDAVNVSKSKNSPGSWINGKLNVSGAVTPTVTPSTPTASSGGKITIKAGTWNVRSTASLSGKIMKVIRGGVTVAYTEKSKDGWYKIDGGWIGSGAVK